MKNLAVAQAFAQQHNVDVNDVSVEHKYSEERAGIMEYNFVVRVSDECERTNKLRYREFEFKCSTKQVSEFN
jgi:hypothetical protein